MILLKNYSIKASSLMESVIAIAIISICMIIAAMVYMKVLESDYNVTYYQAKQKVYEIHSQTIEDQSFEDDYFDFETYQISKEIFDESVSLKKVVYELKIKAKKEKFSFHVKLEPAYEMD